MTLIVPPSQRDSNEHTERAGGADREAPGVERQAAYVRRRVVEEHLSSRRYMIFPGIICDLSDEDERKRAVEWVLELLEEMGI